MTVWRSFRMAALLLALVLVLGETTPLDHRVQDWLFDFRTGRWLVDKEELWPRMIFYTGAKVLVLVTGIGLLAAWLIARKRGAPPPLRRALALMLAAVILVPSLLSGAKNVTNVHCPWSEERYGGSLPHVTPLGAYPPGFHADRPGKCYPAGHPSGGFAFMMLFFALKSPRARLAGLLTGLTLGWAMGLYQMLKGAHFLTHVLVSMLAAWMIIVVIERAKPLNFKFPV